MIAESIPDVQRLTLEDKLILAVELFEEVADISSEDSDPEVVRRLDRRLEEYRRNPDSASPWSEVKARILGSRGR